MAEPTENQPPVHGEGQPSTQVGSLDLSTRKDLGLLRYAVKRRFPIPEKMRDGAVKAIDVALAKAREDGDVDQIVAVVKTIATLEDANQKDEHAIDKNARLDAGKATENVALDPVILRQPIKPK